MKYIDVTTFNILHSTSFVNNRRVISCVQKEEKEKVHSSDPAQPAINLTVVARKVYYNTLTPSTLSRDLSSEPTPITNRRSFEDHVKETRREDNRREDIRREDSSVQLFKEEFDSINLILDNFVDNKSEILINYN